ncbi:MAG: MoaD/ThiS family protein [Gemmatimonadales bacterium]
MTVTILLFANHRELASTGSLDLELPADATVREAVRRLRSLPGLASLPAEPTVAVNREYASLDRDLKPGDEVALIPAVAGG